MKTQINILQLVSFYRNGISGGYLAPLACDAVKNQNSPSGVESTEFFSPSVTSHSIEGQFLTDVSGQPIGPAFKNRKL